MIKGEFEIPNDIKTDLAYCQQAIANHVKFHQVNLVLQCISICNQFFLEFRIDVLTPCDQFDSHATSSLYFHIHVDNAIQWLFRFLFL